MSQINMAENNNDNDPHAHPSDFEEELSLDVLKKWLNSNSSQEVVKLNQIVTQVIEKKQLNVFRYLLEQGYKIDVLNEKKQTALHLLFYKAAQTIKFKFSSRLLYNSIGDINYTDSQRLSLLHIASYLGIVDKVKDFLENKEDKNAIFPYKSSQNNSTTFFTPLHLAALNHQLSTVKLLLEYGANICPINDRTVTPLHLAAGNYNYHFHPKCDEYYDVDLDVLKALICHKSNLNAQDEYGNTPLMSIYSKFFYEQYGWSEAEDLDSETESHIVTDKIKNGKLSKLQKRKLMILLKYGADVTLSNNKGETILHRVISDLQSLRCASDANDISFDDRNHVDMVKMILRDNKEIDIDAKNKLGVTPLQLAVSYMSVNIMQILLDRGADLKKVSLDFDTDNCFWHHHIHPNFESVQNLMSVVDVLKDQGYSLTPCDKLVLLVFLIHHTNECKCSFGTSDTIFRIKNLVNYASVKHVKSVLKKVSRSFDDRYGMDNEMRRMEYFFTLFNQMKMISENFYEEKGFSKVLNNIKELIGIDDVSYVPDNRVASEIAQMKSIQLQDNVNLHDVLMKHPHNIYQYIRDADYSLFKKFVSLKTFIKGHFTKALVRPLVKQLAEDFVDSLIYPNLPEVCRDEILKYLDNEDILNVCLAAAIDDEDQDEENK